MAAETGVEQLEAATASKLAHFGALVMAYIG
jgi:hypothetical protein